MFNKDYVQKHVSYYYHAHYFHILNTLSYYRCGHALPFISLFLTLVPRLFVRAFFACLQKVDQRCEERPPGKRKTASYRNPPICLYELPSWQP